MQVRLCRRNRKKRIYQRPETSRRLQKQTRFIGFVEALYTRTQLSSTRLSDEDYRSSPKRSNKKTDLRSNKDHESTEQQENEFKRRMELQQNSSSDDVKPQSHRKRQCTALEERINNGFFLDRSKVAKEGWKNEVYTILNSESSVRQSGCQIRIRWE